MLQRIQSIWLFLASICGLSGIQLSSYVGTQANGIPSSTLEATDTIPLLATTIAVGVVSLVTIFLFKNRSLQTKLCIAALLLQCLVLYLYWHEVSTAYTFGKFTLTFALQGLAVLLIILALLGIRKDEKIIKESNRLR